jgi:hypothetical protein
MSTIEIKSELQQMIEREMDMRVLEERVCKVNCVS